MPTGPAKKSKPPRVPTGPAKRSSSRCKAYGRRGHGADNCYRTLRCEACGKLGHVLDNCYNLFGDLQTDRIQRPSAQRQRKAGRAMRENPSLADRVTKRRCQLAGQDSTPA